MKIQDIRVFPLAASPPEGGSDLGFSADENLYTLIEVVSDEGVTGLGSVFTSGALVEGSLELMRPMLMGESAI